MFKLRITVLKYKVLLKPSKLYKTFKSNKHYRKLLKHSSIELVLLQDFIRSTQERTIFRVGHQIFPNYKVQQKQLKDRN